MNKKRQTIWLVSMLSIMVVLSAYYLFTDKSGENKDVLTDSNPMNQIVIDMLNENEGLDGSELADMLPSTSDTASEDGLLSDEDILAMYEAQTVSGSFNELEMARQDEWSKKWEQLNNIALDTTKSDEEVAQAHAQIVQMQYEQETIDAIEAELLQNYEDVVILPKDDRWQVIVKSAGIQKSEALSIMEYVIDELNIRPDRISLQVKS